MRVEEATARTRIAVSDILSSFLVNNDPNNKHFDALNAVLPDGVAPHPFQSSELQSELGYRDDIEWTDQHRFLFLEPLLDEDILPFLTLRSSNKWRQFRIYALLLPGNESNLRPLAVRFETPEGEYSEDSARGKHDFFHAQLCNSIHGRNGRIVAQAATSEWLPTSQPSFPMDADNQVSLILCMLTSLYGGAYVYAKLSSTSRHRKLKEHLDKVRALKTECQTDR